MAGTIQKTLFAEAEAYPESAARRSGTFIPNLKLPVHRWFRYSAGYSAEWAASVIQSGRARGGTVLDPFAGAGTTLIAAEQSGVAAVGLEAHPFVARVAAAKLNYRSNPDEFAKLVARIQADAARRRGDISQYPPLIRKCYSDSSLVQLDQLRSAIEDVVDGSAAAELAWLALVSVLRSVSHVGTAPWQYVLPAKSKKVVADPFGAFALMARLIVSDMHAVGSCQGPRARLLRADARSCEGIENATIDLVLTSPPYANNYDYADATRLEMSFMGEIEGWSDLQQSVRQYLVRSCSQHVTERTIDLPQVLGAEELAPIRSELTAVCDELAHVRQSRGGKKAYHLMIACYFHDMARVWRSLRRVCREGASVCFVVGDSAPYGVYVPVDRWNSVLAVAAGFKSARFEKIRDRNVKWENRKHRVPLCEGRLWVTG